MRKTRNILIVLVGVGLSIFLRLFNFNWAIPIIISLVIFHIISLIYYRETRLIIGFHVTAIFLITGYFVYYGQLIDDPQVSLLFRAFDDFGSWILFFLAFGIILQNKTSRFIERSLMVITIFYIIYYTQTRFQIINYLYTIFYPIQRDINNALGGFLAAQYVLLAGIAVLEAFLVSHFERRLSKRKYLEKKHQQEVQEMFY